MATQKKAPKVYSDKELMMIAMMPHEAGAIAEMAKKLGRSPQAIRTKKWKMENKVYNARIQNELRKERKNKVTDTSTTNQRWSKQEEYMILHSSLTDVKLAQKLKRTLGSVAAKRCRLLKEKKNGRKK